MSHPVAGAVIAIETGGSHKTAVVGSNGLFHLELPVGDYAFEGTAANTSQDCVDKHVVVVTTTQAASTQVVCPAS